MAANATKSSQIHEEDILDEYGILIEGANPCYYAKQSRYTLLTTVSQPISYTSPSDNTAASRAGQDHADGKMPPPAQPPPPPQVQ